MGDFSGLTPGSDPESRLTARDRFAKTPLILKLGRLAPITGEFRGSGNILDFDQWPQIAHRLNEYRGFLGTAPQTAK
jgi:hypothetical protein